MQLRADDGTPLEVKEAAVLDSDGEVIVEASRPDEKVRSNRVFSSGRVVQLSGWWLPVMVVVVLLALSLGAVFIGVFLVIALVVSLLKKIFRAFF